MCNLQNSDRDFCENCKMDLRDGDVYEKLKECYPEKSDENLREWASHYGWTPENPKYFKRYIGCYDMFDDYTVAYKCPDCGFTWQR